MRLAIIKSCEATNKNIPIFMVTFNHKDNEGNLIG